MTLANNIHNTEEDTKEIPEADSALDDSVLDELTDGSSSDDDDQPEGFGHIKEDGEDDDENEEDENAELEEDAEDVDYDSFDDEDYL